MSVHKGKHKTGELPPRVWNVIIRNLLRDFQPGNLMADIDPEVWKARQDKVNKRLREMY